MPVGVGVGVRVPLAARVGSGFSPASIPGLALWLDASQLTGLSDGDPVQTWPDLSGHSNDATQATLSMRPTYSAQSFRGVLFDGVDDQLATPQAHDSTTIFFVADLMDGIPWGSSAGLLVYFGEPISGSVYLYDENGPSAPATAGRQCYCGQYGTAAGTTLLRENGTTAATGTSNQSAHVGTDIIGTRGLQDGFFEGTLHEMLVYTGALTLAQIVSVESYLRAKWGTP